MKQTRFYSVWLGGLILAACLSSVTSATEPWSARPQGKGSLHVKIVGLPSNAGRVKAAIYNSESAYEAHQGSFGKSFLPISDHRSEWVLEDIPFGEYALMFYHDANDNQKFDRNVFGLPKERYGFSNDAKPRLGLPSYDAVKFAVDADPTQLTITVQ